MLRMMTREEMDKRSAATKIPNPYQVKEMGIIHIPSPAYTMLWMVDDGEICDKQEGCGEIHGGKASLLGGEGRRVTGSQEALFCNG